jgi:WD40 repeat protein
VDYIQSTSLTYNERLDLDGYIETRRKAKMRINFWRVETHGYKLERELSLPDDGITDIHFSDDGK